MTSSQALHPRAVYTIHSKSPYEHGFYFHPAHPFLVYLSCLSVKYMRGTNEVEGRGERERGGVGWRAIPVVRGFCSDLSGVKPPALTEVGEPHDALHGAELCRMWAPK